MEHKCNYQRYCRNFILYLFYFCCNMLTTMSNLYEKIRRKRKFVRKISRNNKYFWNLKIKYYFFVISNNTLYVINED